MKSKITEIALRQMYETDLMDVKKIAEHFGCSVANVRRVLKKRSIRRGKAFIASGKSPVWNRGQTKCTDERLRKISEMRQGSGNPMSGREIWNKGLTKYVDSRLQSVSDKLSGVSKSSDHRASLAAAKTGKFAEEANNWQGGKPFIDANGYMQLAREGKNVYEHRVIAVLEITSGRELLPSEDVHHIDFNRGNNSAENLMVISDAGHSRLHSKMNNSVWSKQKQMEWLNMNGIKFEVKAHG